VVKLKEVIIVVLYVISQYHQDNPSKVKVFKEEANDLEDAIEKYEYMYADQLFLTEEEFQQLETQIVGMRFSVP
jgi:hypothetical protein